MKKIRIQRVSAFDIIITLALAVVFVALSLQGTGELTQMQRATDDYIQCETLARQLQSGSDYLVEQVRMYTATGQREYMDNYFEELNTTRRRETALEYFAGNYSDTDAFTLLKSAMSTSQYLSYTDRYAMRLMAQATLADTTDWPAEIQTVSLHDSDLTMSDADKMRKAQQLVSNSQYQNMREDMTNNVSESLAALIELTRSRQNRAEQIFTDVYRKIELCAAVLVALMLEICIITRHLVVKPLLQYSQSIQRGQIFPVVGAAELQELALTYNEVYRENQETQKLIRHEAEHDALTDALNRGSFEKILNIYEGGEKPFAMIICDIDIFKQVNDLHGHTVGDLILRQVARLPGGFSVKKPCKILVHLPRDLFLDILYNIGNRIGFPNHKENCDGKRKVHYGAGCRHDLQPVHPFQRPGRDVQRGAKGIYPVLPPAGLGGA